MSVATVETVTAADVRSRAADILEEFDWHQGSAGSRSEGSMCAVGAIMEAADDFAASSVDRIELTRLACVVDGMPASPCGLWPLAVWNDAPGRTKAEVVARLRRG